MSEPRISAVICTYNRGNLLEKALAALCAQTLPQEQFEVIVIDDGSSDNTRQVSESFTGRLPLRYAFQRNAGLASGKNHGLFLARAPIVLFLDDDDVASAGYLEQHLITHTAYPDPNIAVLGYTDLAADVARSPLMYFVKDVSGHLFSYGKLKHGQIGDFSLFWGGRSSCKRDYLLRHGVFNPVFRFGAEDIELGFRLAKHGLQVVYNEQARSTMIRALTYDEFCNRCYRQGQSNWTFATMHQDDAVQHWAEIPSLDKEWESVEPIYDWIIKSGRQLDRLALEYVDASLPLPTTTVRLLYRGYYAAFRASRIKGSMDRKGEAV